MTTQQKKSLLESWAEKYKLEEGHIEYVAQELKHAFEVSEKSVRESILAQIEKDIANAPFMLIRKCGSGAFGSVYSAKRKKDGQIVAAKIIDLEESKDDIGTINREIQTLVGARSCPQLVRYFGSCVLGTKLWIIMEFVDGGSILDRAQESPLDEKEISAITKEILEGLKYLHNEGKIHRDIKAANILICKSGQVKLADFGAAQQLTNTMSKCSTFVGSPYWMAPEVLAQNKYDGKADVWSLGITCYEMALGHPPHHKVLPIRLINMIVQSPPPALPKGIYSADFEDFVGKCLIKDPKDRLSVKELLKLPFAKNAPSIDILRDPNYEPPKEVLTIDKKTGEFYMAPISASSLSSSSSSSSASSSSSSTDSLSDTASSNYSEDSCNNSIDNAQSQSLSDKDAANKFKDATSVTKVNLLMAARQAIREAHSQPASSSFSSSLTPSTSSSLSVSSSTSSSSSNTAFASLSLSLLSNSPVSSSLSSSFSVSSISSSAAPCAQTHAYCSASSSSSSSAAAITTVTVPTLSLSRSVPLQIVQISSSPLPVATSLSSSSSSSLSKTTRTVVPRIDMSVALSNLSLNSSGPGSGGKGSGKSSAQNSGLERRPSNGRGTSVGDRNISKSRSTTSISSHSSSSSKLHDIRTPSPQSAKANTPRQTGPTGTPRQHTSSTSTASSASAILSRAASSTSPRTTASKHSSTSSSSTATRPHRVSSASSSTSHARTVTSRSSLVSSSSTTNVAKPSTKKKSTTVTESKDEDDNGTGFKSRSGTTRASSKPQKLNTSHWRG
eukprot:TRINITY_DN4641_c0_g1_i1.p1 TRINITY_DN4641_c0_g1~~TRINITY_DN4641_c0_g1_i1.p1  ORF type:complete len:785 (+),score=255.93 TRINITY_DN4641_c0_g1_i1:107-2461(+)